MHKPSGPVRSRNSVEIAIKGKKPAPERTRRGPFAVQCWRWGFHHSGCFIQAPSRSRLLSEAEIAGRHRAYARGAEHEIGNAVPIDVAADLRAATRHFVTQLPRFAGKRVAADKRELVVRNRMAVGIEHGELYPVALCGGKISNNINSCIMREQMFRTIGELIGRGFAMMQVASHAVFDQDIAYIAIERIVAVFATRSVVHTYDIT